MARFNCYDLLLVHFSTLTYVTDVATDIALIVYFFTIGQQAWGILTLCFVALSALLIQLFSFHWHVVDRSLTWKTLVIHILCLSPLHRYFRVLQHGLKSRRTGKVEDLDVAYRELNDVCILRMFETYLEAAPQLVLQLYIVLSNLDNFNTLLGFSMFFSLISISWAVTAYTDALHLAFKKLYKRRHIAMLTHMLWQTGMITARVVSIVLFTTVFHAYVSIALGTHLVIMLVWIMRLKPDFGTTPCERGLFTFVAAVVHIFSFLNLKDGRSRYRMAFYYILVLVETAVFMTIWYMCKTWTGPLWFDVTAFSVVFGSFGFGTLMMLLYYGCCHASGPAPIRNHQKPEFLKPSQHQYKPPPRARVYQQPRPQGQHPPTLGQAGKSGPGSIFDVSSTSARINLWLSASLDLSKEGLVNHPDDLLDPAVKQGAQEGAQGQAGSSVTSPGSATGQPLLGNDSYAVDSSRNQSTLLMNASSNRTYGDQEHSIPNYNLIELFSQCRQDPSFISNTSITDSLFNQTGKLTGKSRSRGNLYPDEQNNSLNEISNYINHQSRVSNESNRSLIHEKYSVSPQSHNYNTGEVNNSLTEIANNRSKVSRVSNDSSRSITLDNTPTSKSVSRRNLSPSDNSIYRRMEQQNSFTEISQPSGVGNQSKLSNQSSKSLVYENSPGREILKNPKRLSPLDPSKLWEESQGRLAKAPGLKDYMRPAGSDSRIECSGEATAILTVTPDTARGITHLSLSYSDLNAEGNTRNQSKPGYRSLNKNSKLSNSSSSFCNRGGVNKSLENLSNSSNSNFQMLSLSDMSLQLPDNSGSKNHSSMNTLDIVQGNSQSMSDSRNMRRLSSLDRSYKHSVDSINSRDYSSYLSSDRGVSSEHLSSSDRGLSSSGQTHQTSSGFQSEDSNMSATSPLYSSFSHKPHQYQSTPIVENEIASISAPVSNSVINKRVSLDVEIDPSVKYSTGEEITPVTSSQHPAPSIMMPKTSLFQVEKDLDTLDSPVLPPLHVARRPSSSGSSGSGRFFKDPTLDSDTGSGGSQESVNDASSSRHRSQSTSSYQQKSSTYFEKSSLSALLSDVSSNRNSGIQSSEESLSLSSGMDHSGTRSAMKKASSLPYLDASAPGQTTGASGYDGLDTYTSLPYPRKVSDYLCKDEGEKQRLQQLYSEYSEVSGYRNAPVPSNSEEHLGSGHYANTNSMTNQNTESVNSPLHEQNKGLFDRRTWRSSMDKQMKERLVTDLERMAPKKLYQLRSKNEPQKKKVSPVNITEYTESPYKFRKPGSVPRTENVYANVMSVSKDSLNSDGDSVLAGNATLQHDYENMYTESGRLSGCPIATPESWTDCAFIEEENDAIYNTGKAKNTPSARGELYLDAMTESSSIVSELGSGERSPINTSGINSAFKPVKSNRRSVDSASLSSRASSNATFTVQNDTTASLGEQSRNVANRSLEQGTQLYGQPSRRSSASQSSDGLENASSFQWSQVSETSSGSALLETTDQAPRNYLKMAGKDVFSFSLSSMARDDASSQEGSQHSYTDSIPWEDSENKSVSFQGQGISYSFQNSDVFHLPKSCPRQPLRGLENTPAFSPIYGQDRRASLELLSRKRFMSTPKLSTGSEMSMSSTNSADGSSLKTPHRRRSSGMSKRTFGDNTSTWSAQNDSENISELGNTVYI